MGEQAAKIGKKLEGFGENFFANLGWAELTQDKKTFQLKAQIYHTSINVIITSYSM